MIASVSSCPEREKVKMVCVTITRSPRWVDDSLATQIRDTLHLAIVEVMKVKAEDVELRIRDIGALDRNSGRLAIEIDTGSGKSGWRIEKCSEILLALNEAITSVVPADLRLKGVSNMWLRVFAKGASMPVGRPGQMH